MTIAMWRYAGFQPVRATLLVASAMLAAGVSHAAGSPPGLTALQNSCGACHRLTGPGRLARISDARKTPEGWLMTIMRMQHVHHLQLSDGVRAALVRYLADTQGLAPSEAAPARYALERRPNVPDLQLPGDLQTMCARCHSAARVALQRRDAGEWLKNINWHLAQWPTIEYQQNARDRYWWHAASTVVPAQLEKLFPFHTQAWLDWQRHEPVDLSGRWIVRGHEPGRGDYWGTADISRDGDGDYRATYRLQDQQGLQIGGASHAIVYTGFEWRGRAHFGTRETREVFAAAADGLTLAGRWFVAAHPEQGADWTATRAGTKPRIVAVSPTALHVGTSSIVTIFGSNLGGEVGFGPGAHARLISRRADQIKLRVEVDRGARPGYCTVSVGTAAAANMLVLYDRVDRLQVTPAFAIARLGGGKLDAVSAQFDVMAYEDLTQGGGAASALPLGALPVAWSTAPFNDEAKRSLDTQFAGRIDPNGRFLPAGAGPNRQRKFHGDNTGNLWVLATLRPQSPAAKAERVVGKAHLIVTVQRWVTPPIY